ncbi:MAG: hypothetical protein LBL84_00625 [Candidatus Nomurabacteria bacterium]|jgi:hypothetical protein|nr:hypothetical protein [Candidatus Nomurabacteria bacterium]
METVLSGYEMLKYLPIVEKLSKTYRKRIIKIAESMGNSKSITVNEIINLLYSDVLPSSANASFNLLCRRFNVAAEPVGLAIQVNGYKRRGGGRAVRFVGDTTHFVSHTLAGCARLPSGIILKQGSIAAIVPYMDGYLVYLAEGHFVHINRPDDKKVFEGKMQLLIERLEWEG